MVREGLGKARGPGESGCGVRHTCPKVVFSILPFTRRAVHSLSFCTSGAVMMGVEICFEALMISVRRGTPSVTFMLATPAKWKVLSVIWVPGSLMLCAPSAPIASPGCTWERLYLCRARSKNARREGWASGTVRV